MSSIEASEIEATLAWIWGENLDVASMALTEVGNLMYDAFAQVSSRHSIDIFSGSRSLSLDLLAQLLSSVNVEGQSHLMARHIEQTKALSSDLCMSQKVRAQFLFLIAWLSMKQRALHAA